MKAVLFQYFALRFIILRRCCCTLISSLLPSATLLFSSVTGRCHSEGEEWSRLCEACIKTEKRDWCHCNYSFRSPRKANRCHSWLHLKCFWYRHLIFHIQSVLMLSRWVCFLLWPHAAVDQDLKSKLHWAECGHEGQCWSSSWLIPPSFHYNRLLIIHRILAQVTRVSASPNCQDSSL